jgi:hypothetical protein
MHFKELINNDLYFWHRLRHVSMRILSMTTTQEKYLPQVTWRTDRYQRTFGWAGPGYFSICYGYDLFSGNLHPDWKIQHKNTKPYFTAISGIREEYHPALSCTFVGRSGSIRFADSNRALAVTNTQAEIAPRIQTVSRTLFLNKSNYEQQHSLFEYTTGWLYSQQQNSRQVNGWTSPLF